MMDAPSLQTIEVLFWLGLFSAPLGSLLIFRRLSFAGDALSHATLSGVAIAYLFFGLSFFWLASGALLSSLCFLGLLFAFEKVFRLPSDLSLTVSSAGLFALGLLILSLRPIHLEDFLVGDIASLGKNGVMLIRVWAVILLGLITWLWKPLWALVIDPIFARMSGLPTRWIEFALVSMVGLSVVAMMQTVGVILVAAFLILPAASFLPWARSLKHLVLGAILTAWGISGLGLSLSLGWPQLRLGPLLAVTAFVTFFVSHLIRWIRSKNSV